MSVTPYYEADGITIYCGDAREIVPTLPRPFALVTDPPYGLGDRWTGGTWGSDPMYADARKWDVAVPAADLLGIVAQAAEAIVWGGNLYPLPPSRAWLAWIKSSRMATMADFELAWTSLDRPAKSYIEDRNPDGARLHPTQKPVSLMKWCLGFISAELPIVDAFCGSGSTLRAAKDLGRRAIGVEISADYCAIAVKRLRQTVLALGGAA